MIIVIRSFIHSFIRSFIIRAYTIDYLPLGNSGGNMSGNDVEPAAQILVDCRIWI